MTNNVLLWIMDNHIFTESNFKDWLKNLKIVLNFKKSRNLLEAPILIDLAPDATKQEKKVFKNWQEDNLRAWSYMLASMNKKLQTMNKNMQNVYNILVALQNVFGKNSWVVEYELCATLFNMRLREGMPSNEHIIKMINISRQLDAYEVFTHEKLKVNFILHSLSSSYKPFIMNYNLNRIEHTLLELLNEIQEF